MQWNYNFSAGLAALTCEDLQEGMALQEALDRGSLHHHNRHFTCFFKCSLLCFYPLTMPGMRIQVHGGSLMFIDVQCGLQSKR